MPIDLERIHAVLAEHPPVTGDEAYYRQFDVTYSVVEPLVPNVPTLLSRDFTPDMAVLDIGCGRGDTLIEHADRFRRGVGIDESDAVMIPMARRMAAERGISNLEFIVSKAIDLPFLDSSFDLVFSERGPVGYNDPTGVEALRVLRPGGLMFIETIGAQNGWETRAAFDPAFSGPPSPLQGLDVEGARFERLGMHVRTLASRVRTLLFDDFESWLVHQCYSWNWPGHDVLLGLTAEQFQGFIDLASDPQGRIGISHHTIWIAGEKQSERSSNYARRDGGDAR